MVSPFIVHDRRLVILGHEPDDHGYVAHRGSTVTALRQATLVSSQVSDDRHAPALDIDWRCALTVDDQGAYTVWVDGLGARRHRRVTAALRTAGLLAEPVTAAASRARHRLSRAHRAGMYARAAATAVDETARAAALCTLGPTSDGGFADLVQAVTAALAQTHPAGVPVAGGVPLEDPWPVPFNTPVMLFPSTSHHHLYVETVLSWPDYLDLLRELAAAGLIERGYVSASCERGETRCRLPWVHKGDPLSLPPALWPARHVTGSDPWATTPAVPVP